MDSKQKQHCRRDIWTDLAVLSIDDKGIESVIEFGNSESIKTRRNGHCNW